MKRATLIAEIPAERFRSIDGSVPEIGDVIALDQGFTFPDGGAWLPRVRHGSRRKVQI